MPLSYFVYKYYADFQMCYKIQSKKEGKDQESIQ